MINITVSYKNKCISWTTIKLTIMATAVVEKKVKTAHFMLPVSLRIVSSVVPQGKCSKENDIVAKAVSQVQPLLTRISRKTLTLSDSNMAPVDK